MVSNVALWNRIACFTPDDPQADYPFTERLRRENGWSRAFAKAAVAEYKRFVYLAAVGPRRVTPSDVVDQVWHLHLTFTRSYWEELCGAVVGRALHHNPTKGGGEEDARYREQYARTLALYREEFGAEPPAAFWSDPRARFAGTRAQRWVDTRRHWVIRKPALAVWGATSAAALLTGGAAHATGVVRAGVDYEGLLIGGIVVMALLAFSAIENAFRGKKKKKGQQQEEGGGDFDVDFDGGSRRGKGKPDADEEGGEGGEGGGCGGGCGD
jgi:hypothetical protein